MDSKTCMNVLCSKKSSTSVEWKKGWILRSGECVDLCDDCGSAFEQSVFCDVFHSKESGWRECTCCGKRLHCGCIASSRLLELLDIGGVKCFGCANNLGPHNIICDEKRNGLSMTTIHDIAELQTTAVVNQTDGNSADNMVLMPCISDGNGFKDSLYLKNGDTDGPMGKVQQEEVIIDPKKTNSKCVYSNIAPTGYSQNSKVEMIAPTLGVNHANESITQPMLSITLGDSGNSNYFPIAGVDEREQCKTYSTVPQGPRSRQLLPKPPKSASASDLDTSAEIIQQIRVARPPAEGRGRNQLLPRYWPRITDQELQQISGDSNCKIVPLFEKILSASDAGRIGRLVLPKACAEAYFPPITQPEGIPLKIQDVKGKEWVFQFRFWPNNNSRMYVLEGVTPCIQSMQLQAGDTVTFSRMDPEEKLVMGCRKSSKSVSMQSLTGSTNPHVNALPKHLISACEDSCWQNNDVHGSTAIENLMLQSMLVPESNGTRNIGSKSKRLHIDSQDALELKYTWDEVQDMLQPPPSVRASFVTIEDQDFEEYEEPPVLGKRSIFIVRASGRQEQWVQCDNCFKWRRLPVDVLLPSRWTCAENSWDPNRCSCSAQDELTPRELENLLKQNYDFRKWKMATSNRSISENESSGLNALANAAVLGNDPGTSIAMTTKHPRHRPGCSCIVCIQPPSGKGKHKPTCTCNVCMTVKRRFKTLMMRKKKRQSDREAEIAQSTINLIGSPIKDPSDDDMKLAYLESESKSERNFPPNKIAETTGKGYIDLNSHPDRKEDVRVGFATTQLSMTNLVQIASRPLETYLKQNGLTSLISEKQGSSGSHILPQGTEDSEDRFNEDRCLDSENDEPH